MPTALPTLRLDLEFLPSPLPDRPGLLVRDPLRYSEHTVIIPPLLTRCLGLLDGVHTDIDLRELLFRLTGRLDIGDTIEQMVEALSRAGFLDDEPFRAMRAGRRQEFTDAPVRSAAHAGGGYPADEASLRDIMSGWMSNGGSPPGEAGPPGRVVAIAAPHVTPSGAPATYAAAYGALPMQDEAAAARTFVVLGTSHYGAPGKFGLTRKPFQTPLGVAATDVALVDTLAAADPDGFAAEDYCHAVEHSIEFQILFLQNRFGPTVRILPILCGPLFARRPEDDLHVARALGALGELNARHGDRLTWVLGVDMAHMGRRYGDDWRARAHEGAMVEVAARERARLDRIVAGDADGFWDLVQADDGGDADPLKWCGAAPIYSFLRAVPEVRGDVLAYDHWNIDDDSVVSFAALSFTRP